MPDLFPTKEQKERRKHLLRIAYANRQDLAWILTTYELEFVMLCMRMPDQVLGEAELDGVGALGELSGVDAQRGRGVEEAGAIEVDSDAALPGPGDERGHLGRRHHRTAQQVVAVLQAEEGRAGELEALGAEAGLELGDVELDHLHHGLRDAIDCRLVLERQIGRAHV